MGQKQYKKKQNATVKPKAKTELDILLEEVRAEENAKCENEVITDENVTTEEVNENEQADIEDEKVDIADEEAESDADEETEDDEETGTFKENVKILTKLFMVPLILIGGLFVLFFTFLGFQLNFQSHFIKPTSDGLYGQKESRYIVSTFLSTDKASIDFIDNLEKASKELNVGWYLVDIGKYPRVVEEWNITKSPTYYLIEPSAEKQIVYASYGNKHYSALVDEINNVTNLGMPQNDIGQTETVDGLKVTLKDIENKKDERYKKVTFEINNTSDSTVTIKENHFSAEYVNFKNENIGHTYKFKEDSFEDVEIKAGAVKEVVLYVDSEAEGIEHFQVKFTFEFNGKKAHFTYKLWHNKNV